MRNNTEIDNFNRELISIWESAKNNFTDTTGNDKSLVIPMLSPCFIPELDPDECELLVIGLNPSYSSDSWKKILKEISQQNDISKELRELITNVFTSENNSNQIGSIIDQYFSYEKLNVDKVKDIIKLDSSASNKIGGVDYFTKMRSLTEFVIGRNSPLFHQDIYFYRKTSQNCLKNLQGSASEFFSAQEQLTKEIIKFLKPSYILVSNAYAGQIFRKMYSQCSKQQVMLDCDSYFQRLFNEETGTYQINIVEDKKTHVFFSGMLSGQRALDLGSYERLKWHMKAVKEGKSMSVKE